jgi:hypothetical protein
LCWIEGRYEFVEIGVDRFTAYPVDVDVRVVLDRGRTEFVEIGVDKFIAYPVEVDARY